jgi:hypothetical protein
VRQTQPNNLFYLATNLYKPPIVEAIITIQIYFKNLAKMRSKIETYILIFQTQKKNYQKDKCSILGALHKGW